nr:unnamed protein product [Digitaria exilis]
MSPATSPAAVSVPGGVLILQSPSTLLPFPTARFPTSGAARPLHATSAASRRLPAAAGLLEMGIRGVTVSDVRGFGAQGGSKQ